MNKQILFISYLQELGYRFSTQTETMMIILSKRTNT